MNFKKEGPNLTFFTFTVSSYGSISSATLRLRFDATKGALIALGGPYLGTDPSETFTLYDVSTPLGSLSAGTGGVAAFNDLGTGTVFGSATLTDTLQRNS